MDHGTRVGVVGDNGQGKTTFLRTVCGSLAPVAGEVVWGFGCRLASTLSRLYDTARTEDRARIFEYQAAPGTVTQQSRMLPAACCSAANWWKNASRAEWRRAGSPRHGRSIAAAQIMCCVLDEPGNHLDVESVEAPCRSNDRYPGTVIFTSHDRHFMRRVATHVIEVRAGRVASYPGEFDELRLSRAERNRLWLASAAWNRGRTKHAGCRSDGRSQKRGRGLT